MSSSSFPPSQTSPSSSSAAASLSSALAISERSETCEITIDDISDDIPITPQALSTVLDNFNSTDHAAISRTPPDCIGRIEKIEMDIGSKLLLKADLHGDCASLVKYLQTLQREGYLDERFRVKDEYKGKIIIAFLGDYIDRGDKSFKVLNLLMKLKILNPNEIVLLKGNHENIEFSRTYIHPNETHFYEHPTLCDKLELFFSSLPLATLVGTEDGAGNYEYTCLAHGAVDLDVDLQKLLSSSFTRTTRFIKKSKKAHLSKRIMEIIPPHLKNKGFSDIENMQEILTSLREYIANQSAENLEKVLRNLGLSPEESCDKKRAKLILSALRIQNLLLTKFLVTNGYSYPLPKMISEHIQEERSRSITNFNWGDISTTFGPNNLRGLGLMMTPAIIKDYFRLVSTETRKVKALRVGHAHNHQEFSIDGKRGFIEILPVAGELEWYDPIRDPVDLAQIVTLAATKVKDWTQQTFTRERSQDLGNISGPKPFYKTEILPSTSSSSSSSSSSVDEATQQ